MSRWWWGHPLVRRGKPCIHELLLRRYRRPSVRDRAVAAAARVIAEEGVAALTIEAVARRAQCAMTSVHAQFGGREELLLAVF